MNLALFLHVIALLALAQYGDARYPNPVPPGFSIKTRGFYKRFNANGECESLLLDSKQATFRIFDENVRRIPGTINRPTTVFFSPLSSTYQIDGPNEGLLKMRGTARRGQASFVSCIFLRAFEETDGNAEEHKYLDIRRSVLEGDCIEDGDVGTRTIFQNSDTDCQGVTMAQRQHLTQEELIRQQNYNGAASTNLANVAVTVLFTLGVVFLSLAKS